MRSAASELTIRVSGIPKRHSQRTCLHSGSYRQLDSTIERDPRTSSMASHSTVLAVSMGGKGR